MLELYVICQLARRPLQVIARAWVCRGLHAASLGRRRCADAPCLSSAED